MLKRWLSSFWLLLGLFTLTACGDVGYCVQCVAGHFDVRSRTRPIAEIMADPQVSANDRQRLARVQEIRTFAVTGLGLPDNDSYRQYADIGRPYIVWNVVATPELSLTPRQWCYPVFGCFSYRGYFDENDARALAGELRTQGYDVDLYGVKAYSTLKWFDDPVLNTFLDGDDSQLAGLIFHELAHQVLYVDDDSTFNESFAKTVEMEGLRRWLQASSSNDEWQSHLKRQHLGDEFLAILGRYRGQLAALYAGSEGDEQKRSGKQQILTSLQVELRSRREEWPNPAAIDDWLERGLNNARLASIATYHDQVPAFQALLASNNGNLPAFYAAVAELAQLPLSERTAALKAQNDQVFKSARAESAP